MPNVVGVRFKRAGKVYYFDPGEWSFQTKDPVIVETARGIEFGNVVVRTRTVPDEEIVSPLKKVIRPADEADVTQVQENRAKEREAMVVAKQKIAEHKLDMDLVDVEYTFDRSKVIFYFTAEGRVDFRDLVRDLASAFRTRIELRQIGVRDEAKLLGGLGSCGRELCCATFLGDFAPVSIKMAKEQNLALNPVKISGLCGRLMCCLRYESGQYEEGKAALPEMGSTVVTAQGDGRVEGMNVLRNVLTIRIEGKGLVDFPAEEVEIWKPGTPRPAVPQGPAREQDVGAASDENLEGSSQGAPQGRSPGPSPGRFEGRFEGRARGAAMAANGANEESAVREGQARERQERPPQRAERRERHDRGGRADRPDQRLDHQDRRERPGAAAAPLPSPTARNGDATAVSAGDRELQGNDSHSRKRRRRRGAPSNASERNGGRDGANPGKAAATSTDGRAAAAGRGGRDRRREGGTGTGGQSQPQATPKGQTPPSAAGTRHRRRRRPDHNPQSQPPEA